MEYPRGIKRLQPSRITTNDKKGIWIISEANSDNFGCIAFDKQFFEELKVVHKRNAAQQLGLEAYKLLLRQEMGEEKSQAFIEIHTEVKVILTETVGPTPLQFVRIRNVVLPLDFRTESERTYLFVFEKIKNRNLMRPVGGIMGHLLCEKDIASFYDVDSKSPAMEKVTKGEEHWIVEKCYFTPGEFYSEKVFEDRLLVAPVLPPVNHRTLPMQFYIKDANGTKTNFLADQLVKIVRQRGEALLLFSNYRELDSDKLDKHKLESMSRVIEGKLFDGIPEDERWDSDYNGMLCLMAVVLFQDERVKHWVFVRESNMAKFRVKYQYHSEEAVLESLKKNKLTKYFPVAANMPQDLESACNKLFMINFKTRIAPTTWFKVSTALSGGCISSGTCVMREGYCYLSYVHLQMYVLPELVEDVIEHYQEKAMRDSVQSLMMDDDSDPLFSAIKAGAAPLINRIRELSERGNNSDRGDLLKGLPDIEDCIKEGLFPPCVVHHHMIMDRDKHLRYRARLLYRSLLVDMGFGADSIMEYFCKYFTMRWDYTRDKFYKEFKSLMKINIHANRITPKCDNMMDEHTKYPLDCTGCPFSSRGMDDLVALLDRMKVSPDDMDGILSDAAQSAYSGACLSTFRATLGEPKRLDGVAVRPERYFEEAVKLWKEKKGIKMETTDTVVIHSAKRVKTEKS